MKKILKKYFLFIALHPIGWAAAIPLFLFVLYVVGISIFRPTEEVFCNLDRISHLEFLMMVILLFINWIVVHKKVTVFPPDKTKIILLCFPNGKWEIYQKPIWVSYKKISHCTIELPKDWSLPIAELLMTDFEIPLKINIDERRSDFLFELSFIFTEELEAEDLKKMILNYNSKGLSVDTFRFENLIQNIFEISNLKEEKLKKIRGAVTSWQFGYISRAALKKEIESIVNFPENILSSAEAETSLLSLTMKVI